MLCCVNLSSKLPSAAPWNRRSDSRWWPVLLEHGVAWWWLRSLSCGGLSSLFQHQRRRRSGPRGTSHFLQERGRWGYILRWGGDVVTSVRESIYSADDGQHVDQLVSAESELRGVNMLKVPLLVTSSSLQCLTWSRLLLFLSLGETLPLMSRHP